ncbi:MAG: efflux RND transporter periplasmic adaptor subunit [Terriglobales bacterium]
MKTWKKVLIAVGAVLALVIIVSVTVYQSRKNLVTVQTGKAQKQTLSSIVSASGEIKPKTYVNIGANAFGKIVKLHVKEGDHVKKGQLLAQLENVQSSADVSATRASLADHTRLDWERAQGLYKDALIAKQDYDTKKAAWESAQAGLAQAKARVDQAKAQMDSAQKHISQNQANLTRVADVLQKTLYEAPYDGVITNLPVREGETVVMGIQNAPGSTLMTLADMSVITAEVKVDETDIVNVRMGQPAEVTIDAIPHKTFHGTVTEIGDNAIVRSTGVSTSQATSTSEEAKDFKVVVTLSDSPPDLRPGLSTTAKITTATRNDVVSIPIQALTVRTRADLVPKDESGKAVQAAAPVDPKSKEEVQGVFVIRHKKAEFVPVDTGISGTTDIEVTKGVQAGDEVITGSYKVLRTLKPGTSVKIDNSEPKKEDESS